MKSIHIDKVAREHSSYCALRFSILKFRCTKFFIIQYICMWGSCGCEVLAVKILTNKQKRKWQKNFFPAISSLKKPGGLFSEPKLCAFPF